MKNPLTNKSNPSQPTANVQAFAFGDPEPVLGNNITDYLGTFLDVGGDYYVPPISLDSLANLMGANPHHNSILHFKKNMILNYFQPTDELSYSVMQKLSLDYVVTGNVYPQFKMNRLGRNVRLDHQPAVAMRVGRKDNVFYRLNRNGKTDQFKPGEIAHIKEPDIKQGIYGMPEYIGGIQSVLLSEEAGLFRRKYYINGAHMGYILLAQDLDLDEKDEQQLEKQIKDSKGPGNFRSLFLSVSRSQAKEPVKIIPVGDIATKDEFERVKNITRDEILSMHRMQPGLSGIMPENTTGFGDLKKIMEVYYELEIIPMQQTFLELNHLFGRNIVKFKDPDWKALTEESS